jgi:hypothetical protein
MKKTLEQIIAAHPELREPLTSVATRFSAQSFDDDGNILYPEEGILIAARAETGADAFSRGVKGGHLASTIAEPMQTAGQPVAKGPIMLDKPCELSAFTAPSQNDQEPSAAGDKRIIVAAVAIILTWTGFLIFTFRRDGSYAAGGYLAATGVVILVRFVCRMPFGKAPRP